MREKGGCRIVLEQTVKSDVLYLGSVRSATHLIFISKKGKMVLRKKRNEGASEEIEENR
jgi:hypothetical protein